MTQKSKRLYFTDPIKALYMMKEFGVKFEMIDCLDDILKEESYVDSNLII